MSFQFLVFTDANGTIPDPHNGDDISTALSHFGVRDVFLCSHGWWTSPLRATEVYNRFSIGLAARALQIQPALPAALGIGLHWPSMVGDSSGELADLAEALSYFSMGNRANAIGATAGYALLRILLESPNPLRIHLIGHSFGCKVACMALQRIAEKGVLTDGGLPNGSTIDVVLLQAAFNNDDLEPTRAADYENVIGIPGLRMLITKSTKDLALKNLFVDAQVKNLLGDGVPALGYSGPTPAEIEAFNGSTPLSLNPGFSFGTSPPLRNGRFAVADLTALHQDPHYEDECRQDEGDLAFELCGHHNDIFLPEIYDLILAFLFKE